ncbi:RNA-binding S4 domain-containing protein [Glaciimonas sp. GS1]|uniref:RNA-binding S4 domain-containing protein n=1 Tax=Glaciimonas soli TaxID=2590999 RepID=A0A843YS96_9BURK|nr:RNA-binding S4 domain-containing protein [Glaciimonas soli]
MSEVRIDKWLWTARFFKTRSLASTAVDNGKVQVDGDRIKPARHVKIGDLLAIENGNSVWEVVVQGLADVRSSAAIAQTLYKETEVSVNKRLAIAEDQRYFSEPTISMKGRPTKRDRRLLDKNQ